MLVSAPHTKHASAATLPAVISLASRHLQGGSCATALLLTAFACAWALPGSSAMAQPPAGQSARLIGVHDLDGDSQRFLRDSGSGCDRGWITIAHAIGTSDTGGFNASGLNADGISAIVRLDYGWEQTVGRGDTLDGYVNAFRGYVENSNGVHVWIVGNEPNVTLGDINSFVTPYAEAYKRVRNAVHGLSGHEDDLVLLSAPSPWSPCFLDGFALIIEAVDSAGVTVDGFAIHPYTGHTMTTQETERVTRDDMRTVCNGSFYSGTIRYAQSYGEFRVYKSFIDVIEDTGHSGAPVFATEAGHACENSSGNCYADTDVGYFTAMYQEVADWNATAATKIRAITPYRWTGFGDGSARNHAIGNKPNLLTDLARASSHTWTTPACGGGEDPPPAGDDCTEDRDCRPDQMCGLAAGECEDLAPCGSGGACPDGQVCRADSVRCVPAHRGGTRLQFEPAMPSPGDVRIAAGGPDGFTWIGARLEGPLGEGGELSLSDEMIGRDDAGEFRWSWAASLPGEGTYRATFWSDKESDADTDYRVRAIRYVHLGEPPADPPPPSDGGTDDTGTGDSGTSDAGGDAADDAGGSDTGGSDTGGLDASSDTGTGGDGSVFRDPDLDSGCDCGVAGQRSEGTRGGLSLLALLVLGLATRRRL